jgi:hypothetical protein
VTRTNDVCQMLAIEVDQIAGVPVLVTNHGWRRGERAQRIMPARCKIRETVARLSWRS